MDRKAASRGESTYVLLSQEILTRSDIYVVSRGNVFHLQEASVLENEINGSLVLMNESLYPATKIKDKRGLPDEFSVEDRYGKVIFLDVEEELREGTWSSPIEKVEQVYKMDDMPVLSFLANLGQSIGILVIIGFLSAL